MKQVEPYQLWIGHLGEGNAREKLDRFGIRAVVELAIEERPLELPREMVSYRFPLVDGLGNDEDLLGLAIAATASLVRRQIPALLCCGAGMSRSPSIAAAGIAVSEMMAAPQALQIVNKHHRTDVLPGLWQQIIEVLKGRHFARLPD